MIDPNARELYIAHLYNMDAIKALPATVRAAERLGFTVDINVTKDGMGKIHSLQVMTLAPEPPKQR